MKKTLFTIAAIAALGAAVPASAQYGRPGPDSRFDNRFDNRGDNRGDNRFDNRIDMLRTQIQQGVQRGTISYREARPLQDDVRKLNELERKYSYGGFSWSEQDKLQRKIENVREKIRRAERSGGYGRPGRW